MRFALLLALVAACGPGLAKQPRPVGPSATAPKARPGVPPPDDEVGFRKLLVGEVANGGLWFPDASCQGSFGVAGKISPDAFDAFAHCVATLHLRPTGRAHWHDDASVLTDDAGFEIEALVANGQLQFIGFAARAAGMPDLPTITPDALEKLRISGDPKAIPANEFVRVCIDESGTLKTVMPGTAMAPQSFAALSTTAHGWTFRPFTAAGTPMSVCAIVGTEPNLPQPPEISKAGHVVYQLAPTQLEELRLSGSKLITPDDEDKTQLAHGHPNGMRVIGSFKLCLDETGRYERGVLLKSTGIPRYDAKIARELMTWTYKPYLVDGAPTPVCTAVTFIYSQH